MISKAKLFFLSLGLIGIVLVVLGVASIVKSTEHDKVIRAETRAEEAMKNAEALRVEHGQAKVQIQSQAKVIQEKQQIADTAIARYKQLAQIVANQPTLPPVPPECAEAVKPYREALVQSKQALEAASDAIAKLEQSDQAKALQISKLTLDNQTLEKMSNQYMLSASSYKVALDAERSATRANAWKISFKNLSIGFGLGVVAGRYAGR